VTAIRERSLRSSEEIAVLLRETELDEALIVAERLREAVRAVNVPDCTATVSASPGLAQICSASAVLQRR